MKQFLKFGSLPHLPQQLDCRRDMGPAEAALRKLDEIEISKAP